ncbi:MULTISPECIES: BsuBI/PstI family type II restriction endonuclease [Rhizobium]|uniref:BsuBI/PstI family type II restriction endonuclease n=1 Tax=Rhizobium tumorigenes TaxID=2041385 RepID=A0AAF1KWB8_9HYPH|nr:MULTISPECIES: BsuBI/PstI family type II restriction endonuclease [Rhizobium]MBO9102290.1 restriction endonuclease [Rhizobium sp. L58/93]MBO9172213.1 restriction endonuclease [Rhizobium sp. L245/93]MBO9187781.1 restriction endonuclease [Rhizobium sp. E27B/91]QXZ87513.1 restriction endonuclease [Rhizobium sp. K1/93]QXZ93553.1 restriction endonuclease [Rhizobium sp. K15/93]
MAGVPIYVPWTLVAERLPLIFPEGTPNRGYCIREMAAKTIFVALYISAVEGSDRYLGPAHVYRMTNQQAALADQTDRDAYVRLLRQKNGLPSGDRWYADNSREPIRDETLREGLVAIGAVLKREDLPTTSGLPRYQLKTDFAALFDPVLEGEALETAIAAFQTTHLSKLALARVSIMLSGAAGGGAGVLVTFPNKETRNLAPGPSSIISKAVVEEFAPRFLGQPAVLWLSESGNKVVAKDDKLASAIGLKIEADKNLPDLILVDLSGAHPLLVFVEVVATDGPITDRRREALYQLTDAAGFPREQVTFLTAYQDRESSGFRKTVSALSWGSFAWFLSEPAQIVVMRDGADGGATLGNLSKI